MAKTEIDSVIKTIREQGYKYCRLLNANQKAIIPFNRPSDKNKAELDKKIEEIKNASPLCPMEHTMFNVKTLLIHLWKEICTRL